MVNYFFAPASYHWGKAISVVSLLLVLGLALLAELARRFRRQRRPALA